MIQAFVLTLCVAFFIIMSLFILSIFGVILNTITFYVKNFLDKRWGRK